MNKILALFFCVFLGTLIAKSQATDTYKTALGNLKITPVLHGSLVIQLNEITIFVDPYGGSEKYAAFSRPDIVLITDIHGDHLHQNTLDGIDTSNAEFIIPSAVKEKLSTSSKFSVLNNGQGIHRQGIFIEAIPMYNLPEDKDSRHPKGRGNGYVLTLGDTNIYISGDTEDIEEMRRLRNIDIAFICMNLPYTMSIDQAASAVLEFQPRIVYPFHYRGKDGLSDIESFKKQVEIKNRAIEVKLRNWYPD